MNANDNNNKNDNEIYNGNCNGNVSFFLILAWKREGGLSGIIVFKNASRGFVRGGALALVEP